jgi:hypothetical protein
MATLEVTAHQDNAALLASLILFMMALDLTHRAGGILNSDDCQQLQTGWRFEQPSGLDWWNTAYLPWVYNVYVLK